MLFGIRCDGHVSLELKKSNFDPLFSRRIASDMGIYGLLKKNKKEGFRRW